VQAARHLSPRIIRTLPFTPMQVRSFLFPLLVGVPICLVGCSRKGDIHIAPAGFGVVREHMISVPNNIPPVRSEFDFTITEIDGGPVTREMPPPLVDMQPGALVRAGVHRFKAKIAPHLLPAGYRPHEVSFVATIESEKIYFLVDRDGEPVLVEEHLAVR
jgi:hypothetical protein